MLSHLVYLHGFRSSPLSTKARKVADWVQHNRPDLHWWCPQLPPSPREAMDMVMRGIADWPAARMAVIGSSLGGFYATVVAERSGCPAVLLIPAVEPARDLASHVGETTAWHSDERFFFRAGFVDELHELQPARITRVQRYLALVAKGDEVLDWHEMAARSAGCHLDLIEGGDHALTDFDAHWPRIVRFLDLASTLHQ
jgi:predicted esterase YcpF (UPF0227 family)